MEEGQEDLHKDFGEEKNSENLLLTITRTFVDVHQFFCRPCVDRKPLQDRLWRTDHLKVKKSHLLGLMWRKLLYKYFRRENTLTRFSVKKIHFTRPSVEKTPLKGLLWRKWLFKVFSPHTERPSARSSVEKDPLQELLWRENLNKVFCEENTFCKAFCG